MKFLSRLYEDKVAGILIFIFAALTIWWILLDPSSTLDTLQYKKQVWGASYQILALIGGLYGLFIARNWGGLKSYVGKSVFFFSLGLLFQVLGQTVYSFYNLYYQTNALYPSLGDVGFFGTIPLYFLGAYYLTKASGIKASLKSVGNKVLLVIIPLLIFSAQYYLYLRHYSFDLTTPIKTLLDYGYPLGDALNLSMAILAFLLCVRMLGGVMKTPMLSLIFAFFMQYVADIYFFYQANNDLYFSGNFADFLYAFSYLAMALALTQMVIVYRHIRAN
jgi:hypothetical protein